MHCKYQQSEVQCDSKLREINNKVTTDVISRFRRLD